MTGDHPAARKTPASDTSVVVAGTHPSRRRRGSRGAGLKRSQPIGSELAQREASTVAVPGERGDGVLFFNGVTPTASTLYAAANGRRDKIFHGPRP
jgi:hypothetical protein